MLENRSSIFEPEIDGDDISARPGSSVKRIL